MRPLPVGRRRVAAALIGDGGRTYRQVAELLGIHRGSVYEHLRRIRLVHPEVYKGLMEVRAAQLAARHTRALAKAQERSAKWCRAERKRQRLSDSDWTFGLAGII